MECFPKKTRSYLIMNQRNLHSSTMICYYLDYLPQPATSHTSLPTLPPAFRTTKTWGEKNNFSLPSCHPKQPLRKHSWQEVISSHTGRDGSSAMHGISITNSDSPAAAIAIPNIYLKQVEIHPWMWKQNHPLKKDAWFFASIDLEDYKAQVLLVGNCCLLPKVQLINGIILLCWNPWATICRSLGNI